MALTSKKKPKAQSVPEFCIAAIGASAGGLAALKEFCAGLTEDPRLAIVVVLHRDPNAESSLDEILARECGLPIVSIKENTPIERNHIYLAPADKFLTSSHAELRPIDPPNGDRHHMPIDFLLRSLAQTHGDKAIAIILSGSGTDGVLGLQAIKAAGGLTLAQSLDEAEHPSMPHHAVATGAVDLVLEASQMGAELARYVQHSYVMQRPAEQAMQTKETDLMASVFALLRSHTGHDFTNYKFSTISRRIERRMAVHKIDKLYDYVRYLSQTPNEVDTLFKELLINVTNFFRDPESFDVLKERVLPPLFSRHQGNPPIRVWVPGCATGEEAYSLAISLIETADTLGTVCDAQIFATDIHEASLETARIGRYPDSIAADVSTQRLQRFFTKEDHAYRVSKQVREMVIVAKQDLIKDPPFSKLDLIVCRNLLIYLNSALQKKLVPLFHYSLNPYGILMLGPSESIGGYTELFSLLDKRWRVFERKSVARTAIDLPTTPLFADGSPSARSSGGKQSVGQLAAKALLDAYAPACVIVNEKYEILHFQGSTAHYLEPPSGEPTLNLLRMAKEDLRTEMRSILHKVFERRHAEIRRNLRVNANGRSTLLNLVVKPFSAGPTAGRMAMVVFEEADHPPHDAIRESEPLAADQRIYDLEYELNASKDSLQTTIEELETSNEELKSANEELQSTNEELQSTNEELETSKEELQSINEELITVNSELQLKLDELAQANSDVVNLLASTDVATIFLDSRLRIKRFTANVGRIVNLISSDIGRHIGDIALKLLYEDLVADAEQVLQTLVTKEYELSDRSGGYYSMRIAPYRTVGNVIDGVVITFVNISELKKQRQAVEAAREYADNLLEQLPLAAAILNHKGEVLRANQAWKEIFSAKGEAITGQPVYALKHIQRIIEPLRDFIQKWEPAAQWDIELAGSDRQPRKGRLSARRISVTTAPIDGESEFILMTMLKAV